MKKIFREYLSFSRRDRIGIVGLVILLLLIYFLPILFEKKPEDGDLRPGSLLAMAIDSLDHSEPAGKENKTKVYNSGNERLAQNFSSFTPFEFDPNKLNPEGWQKLGLSARTIQTINKYISKGGRFKKSEDLQKIWGLPDGFYDRVKNYIVISNPDASAIERMDSKPSFEKKTAIQIFDINEADTAAFISLPGIGSKLAGRIILFREKLGGFYSIDQIKEVYGIQDSVFQKIRSFLKSSETVRKININTATKEELKAHPYIKWNLANAIVAYRDQHGNFKMLDDLKNINLIDEATFDRIVHYLEL